MRRQASIPAVCVGVLLLAAFSGSADMLVLRGGEALSGRLLDITDGTVTFVTTLSGQMMVHADQVETLATVSAVQVAMDGEPPEAGQFVAREGSTFLLTDSDPPSKPVNLAEVASATPMPEDATQDEQGNGLQGAWETGVHYRSANKDYTDLFARLALTRATDEYAFRHVFLLERADPEHFPRWFQADAEWRLSPGDSLYPVAAIEAERDADAALGLRGNLSLGIGKDLLSGEDYSIEGSVGVGGTVESWDADLVGGDTKGVLGQARWRTDSEREDQLLNLRLTLRYARTVFQTGAFEGDVKLYPSIVGFGEFRARSQSSVLFPVTSSLKLKLDLLVDYESTPGFAELDNWRTSVGAGLRWDF